MKSRWSCLRFLALLTWVWLVSLGYSKHGYAETCPNFQAFLQATAELDISTQETTLRRHIDALAKTGGIIQLVTTSRNKPAIHLPQSGRFQAKDVPLSRFRHLKPHLELLFASPTPDPFTPRFSIDLATLEARIDEIFRLSLSNTDDVRLYEFGSFQEHADAARIALDTLRKKQPARALPPHNDDDEVLIRFLEEDLLGTFETMSGRLPNVLANGSFSLHLRDRWVQWLLLNPLVFRQSSFELLTFYILNFGATLTESDKAFLSTLVITSIENSQHLAKQAKPKANNRDSGIWTERVAFLQYYPRQRSQHYKVWYEILSRSNALNRIQETYGIILPPLIEQASFPSLMRNAQHPDVDDPKDGKFSDISQGIQRNGLKNIFALHVGKAVKDVPPFSRDEVPTITEERMTVSLFGPSKAAKSNTQQLVDMPLYHRTSDLSIATLIAQGESVASLGSQSVFGGSSVWGEGVYVSLASDLYHYGPFVVAFRLNPDAIIGKDIDIFKGQGDGYIVVAKNNSAFLPTETRFEAKQFPNHSEPGYNHIQWISQMAQHLTRDEKRAYVTQALDAVMTKKINPYAFFVVVEACRPAITDNLQTEVDKAFAYQQVHYLIFPSDFYPDIFEKFDVLEVQQSLERDELTRKFFKNEAVLTFITHAPDLLTRYLGKQGMIAMHSIAELKTPEDLILAMDSFARITQRMQDTTHLNLPELIRINNERHRQNTLIRMREALKWIGTQDLEAIHPARLLAFYDAIFTSMTAMETHPFRDGFQALLLRIGKILVPFQQKLASESPLPAPLNRLRNPAEKKYIQDLLLKYDFETATLRPSMTGQNP